MPNQDNSVVMEGVDLIFKNFSGKEGQYNKEGDRNFGVLLNEEIAQALSEDGWNVKVLQPREDADEGEVERPWLPVALGFGKGRPPQIVLITSRGKTHLDEQSCEMLDWADIINVDLIIRPYNWEVNGRGGTKAYCKSLYVTIEEDPLEQKYGDLDAQG